LAQHTCSNCGTSFIDGDFCPDCGQWVDEQDSEEFSLSSEPEQETTAYTTVPCPSCGSANPSANRHCEECGARLHQGALPVAPQPMIQTSAGVRAAAIIGAVLILVIAGAWIFNQIFGGDETAVPETTISTESTLAPAQAPLAPVPVVTWECSSELNERFSCANLGDDDPETSWNDASLKGQDATITATFDGEYSLESMILSNLADDVRFARNYRIQGIEIVTDDNPAVTPGILPNTPGPQVINYLTLRTTTVTITVTSIYPSEEIEGESAFDELALQEIEFFGRAVTQ